MSREHIWEEIDNTQDFYGLCDKLFKTNLNQEYNDNDTNINTNHSLYTKDFMEYVGTTPILEDLNNEYENNKAQQTTTYNNNDNNDLSHSRSASMESIEINKQEAIDRDASTLKATMRINEDDITANQSEEIKENIDKDTEDESKEDLELKEESLSEDTETKSMLTNDEPNEQDTIHTNNKLKDEQEEEQREILKTTEPIKNDDFNWLLQSFNHLSQRYTEIQRQNMK